MPGLPASVALQNTSTSSGYGGTFNNNTGIVLGNATYPLGTIVATDITSANGAYYSKMAFAVNGADISPLPIGILIQGVGNNAYVGINGTTPAYPLDVNGNINASGAIYSGGSSTGLVLQGTGTDAYVRTLNGGGTLWLGYGSTNSVAINSSGIYLENVPVYVGANLEMYTTGYDSVIRNNNTGWLYLNSNGTNGVEISSGGVGIMGSPNGSYALNVNGAVNASSYNASSDYRIKKDVVTLDETFSVDNLRPVTYNNTQLKKQDIGLIAHELQEVYPELVTGEKDGEEMQSVNYIGLIPILINEIKMLKKELSDFKKDFYNK